MKMHGSPHYTTKIIAGKLVTVPVYNQQAYQTQAIPQSYHSQASPQNYHSQAHASPGYRINSRTSQLNYTDTPYHVNPNNHAHNNQLSQARLEAQKNKARAFAQTYRSVLSPEPNDYIKNNSSLVSDTLMIDVASHMTTLSRHKLLTALSSMRRLDPNEYGVLSFIEVEDIMSMYNIKLGRDSLNNLFERYHTSQVECDYRAMWKFVMDCYAKKDLIDVPTKDVNQKYRYESNIGNELSQGLRAELEFELRKYARTYNKQLDVSQMADRLRCSDQYGTGKILSRHVVSICRDYLQGISSSVIQDVIPCFDSDKSGMVYYEGFVDVLQSSQPIYLPPLQTYNIQSKVKGNKNTSWLPQQHKENNHEKLKDIGELALHLSDFETQVTSRKSPSSARLPDSHDVIINLPSSPPPERSSSAATYVVDSPKTSPRRSASTLLKQ